MINSDEMLFVVDENNNPTQPQPRGLVHKTGLWHRTVHIWITDNRGHLLCNKRSSKKDQSASVWAGGIGGHTLSSANSFDTALSEIKEEMGVVIDPKNISEIMTFKNSKVMEFQTIYIMIWTGDIYSLKAEADEIEQFRWFDIRYIYDAIQDQNNHEWVKESNPYAIQFFEKHFGKCL